MKVGIVSTGPDLGSQIFTNVGHSFYLLIVDTETMKHEWFLSSDIDVVQGIGLKTAQLLVNKNAEILITHLCGPFCYETLTMTGIRVITDVSGTVRDVLRKFKKGKLDFSLGANIKIKKASPDKKIDILKRTIEKYSSE